MLKKLPLDVSSFKLIIEENYLYIDKTEYIYNLFNSGNRYYFLSRPRRFGKSLLVSTLKELFSGNKELFKDLYIYNSDWEFKEYPVIYLDFSVISHKNSIDLELNLIKNLNYIAIDYGFIIDQNQSAAAFLNDLLRSLSKINKVVILIDEYDKPILDHINNLKEAEEQRKVLKSFYDIIKGQDQYLRAIFLTGVTKFAKTSVFSGLNNLNDITVKPEASTLLGYTEKELLENFDLYIKNFSDKENISKDNLVEKLRYWYNGYRFSKVDVKVYNPFSILYALKDQEIDNYWISSGNPEFLITILKEQYNKISDIEDSEFSYNNLETFDLKNINIITLLFQTGYLTIKNYDKDYNSFKVNFPNQEIKNSFANYLMTAISNYDLNTTSVKIFELKRAIESNNLDDFFSTLSQIFAHIPYTVLSNLEKEKDYHMMLQLIFSVLSINSQSEIITNTGRIYLIIETKNYFYIFEFKLNKSTEIALKQINNKEYYQRFLNKNKKITLIGINFINNKNKTKLEFEAKSI